ncbi:hypothetical protein GE21DRAFT_1275080 [Neurospora crassa]|nr:hypothetical protein GE21DRAFT_1275080 [Neurospora crassa]
MVKVKVKVSLDRTWMSCECYGVRNPNIRTKHSGCNVEYLVCTTNDSAAQRKSRFHSDCRGLEMEMEMELELKDRASLLSSAINHHLPASARHGDHMGNVISTPTHRPEKQRQPCLEATENTKYYPTRRRIPNRQTEMLRRLVLSTSRIHYTTRTCSSIRHAHELTVRARQGLKLETDTTQAGFTQATRTHIHYTT